MDSVLQLFPYQEETVRRVREELGWRAIIADEVGLGKTIEAGALIADIRAEIEDARVLLLTPKALLMQWRGEMLHKFGIYVELEEEYTPLQIRSLDAPLVFAMTHDKLAVAGDDHPVIESDWDLIVVDEAHKFSNPDTARRTRLGKMRSERLVLLTATPMQNSLVDVYSLVNLLRPKLLGHSTKAFLEQYAFDLEGRQVKSSMRGYLKKALASCLTRTTRDEAGIQFVKRLVSNVIIKPGFVEDELDRRLRGFLSEGGAAGEAMNLRQAIASHPAAAVRALAKCGVAVNDIPLGESVKEEALLALVGSGDPSPWLVFVNRRVTGLSLVKRLEDRGYPSAFYHGGLSTTSRDSLIEQFRRGATMVLVATDAGSEGLNLQHCSRLVNYDLHWNPLRMEQRIGRVHRFGQSNPVEIYNLVLEGSLDKLILERVYLKIDLFQRVIGELTSIMGVATTLDEMRRRVESACLEPDIEALDARLSELGSWMGEEISAAEALSSAQPV